MYREIYKRQIITDNEEEIWELVIFNDLKYSFCHFVSVQYCSAEEIGQLMGGN